VKSALIGYTGFVGSNILASQPFDDLYNSSNIGDIVGRTYDLVVSAAGAADSFRINHHVEEDRASLDLFASTLSQAEIHHLALISTVCVYGPTTDRPDENTPIKTADITPYGRNRHRLERVLSDRFNTTIIRLPQLYGRGLKKGIIYDLMNNYRVEHIRPEGRFQYYGLDRLWSDIELAVRNGLGSLNIATPSISNADIARSCFGIDITDQVPPEPESVFSQMYTRSMATIHSGLFGRDDGYLVDEDEELRLISKFIEMAKGDDR